MAGPSYNTILENTITIPFNKYLSSTYGVEGVDISKISIAKDGVKIQDFTAKVNSSDKRKVDITVASKLTGGIYTVTFNPLAVCDQLGNRNDLLITTVSKEGNIFQPLSVTVSQTGNGQNMITIKYLDELSSVKMGNSALERGNYKLNNVLKIFKKQ